MEYEKIIIPVILAIFLFSITGVCASEMDTTIASDDTNGDTMQTDEENIELTEDSDDETLNVQNDEEELSQNPGNYSGLAQEIGSGGNIQLQHDYYNYDGCSTTIKISVENSVIDGKGAVIDMAGSSIRAFRVTASGVTIKNLTIKNANYNGNGGAIYFSNGGTVSNCNFNNNRVTGDEHYGGAILFKSHGNVVNCNFTGNSASDSGGAIHFDQKSTGSVINSTFTNNYAYFEGGAIYLDGNNIVVENCSFTGNSAVSNAGALSFGWGTVRNCNFTGNKVMKDFATSGAIHIEIDGSVENSNFVNNTSPYDGGAIYIFTRGNVIKCNFSGNTANNLGGAIFMDSGSVTNSIFTDNKANRGSAIYSHRFSTVSHSCFLNNRASAVALDVTLNDNNITITFTGNDNLLNAIYADVDVTFTNVTYWGADGIANTGSSQITPVRSNKLAGQNISIIGVLNGNDINMTKVTDAEGQIVLEDFAGDYYIIIRHYEDSYYTGFERIASHIKFNVDINSQTTYDRAVNITATSDIKKEYMPGNLKFVIQNHDPISANYAGNGTWWLLYTFDAFTTYSISAAYEGLDNVSVKDAAVTIIKPNSTITLDNIVMDYGKSFNLDVMAQGALGIKAMIDDNYVSVIDFKIMISGLNAGNHTLTVTTFPDENHTQASKTVNITVNKVDSSLIVDNVDLYYGESKNVTVTAEGALAITAKIDNIEVGVVNFTIPFSGLNVGNHTLTVTTIPDANHTSATVNATVTVNKLKTELLGNPVTATYNVNKYLVITLKDSAGNALSGVDLVVDLNGVKTYTTDNNGQVKVFTKTLSSKTYTAKITFNGNTNYEKSTKDVKVTVNKAANTLKVKAKTVKVKFAKLKKKAQKLKVTKVVKFTKKGQGTLTYKKVKGNKKITINKKTGKVTIKKGLKKGTYKVKMKIKAKGNTNYKASAFKTLTFKIKIK